ncbi:MAG TPA: twin-arginine translocase TatA/TatE family subunit [Flavobacterium sp.]|jgi:sec-independent protein translocase protein TatA|nr:twin-arginine translocase TatA/TatE family subunit [Flavobacterium sp.]
MGRFGLQEVLLILLLVLILFGGKKIPELMKGLGSGIKEFKDATKDKKEGDSSESQKEKNNTDSKS